MAFKFFAIYYIGLSIVSSMMLAWDKYQAIRGRWRVREKTLHSFELLGGWPGALLVTRSINHKIRKPKYMWTLYGIGALHVIGWMLLMWIASS